MNRLFTQEYVFIELISKCNQTNDVKCAIDFFFFGIEKEVESLF
jgi:hypothetical protein